MAPEFVGWLCACCRADSRFVPSQWETLLQSNAIPHWLGANLESAVLLLDHGWLMGQEIDSSYASTDQAEAAMEINMMIVRNTHALLPLQVKGIYLGIIVAITSLRPGDAIRGHISGSALVQVMDCCLMAPSITWTNVINYQLFWRLLI